MEKIIFKTHLDVGFTDYAARVESRYFRDFLRQAVATADHFRESGSPFRFRWTVGAWLIHEALERADSSERKFLEAAIERGDLVWHALPFTMHSEAATAGLFRYALRFSGDLDRRFGRHTVAAKLTDVPGHTRGIVAPLAEAGVKLLHIGINPASAACRVPRIFRWRDRRGNELLVVYQPDYGTPLEIPGTEIGYLVSVKGDNLGAQSASEVEALLQLHPGAVSATFDDLARDLEPLRETLPVVEAELGDSWIHGIASDPRKCAEFRELARLREERPAIAENPVFNTRLLQVVEHTWGLDEKTHFPDRDHWTAEEIAPLLGRKPWRAFSASWREQRRYLTCAVNALPPEERQLAARRLRNLRPRFSSSRNYTSEREFEWGGFHICIDPETGALSTLETAEGKLADGRGGWFGFSVQSFGQAEFRRFRDKYLRCQLDWALCDFGKPGMKLKRGHLNSGFEPAVAVSRVRDKLRLVISGHPRGIGAPELVELAFEIPGRGSRLAAELRWRGRSPERRAHAYWLDFVPAQPAVGIFTKLGETIDPRETVSGGGRMLHAIDGTVRFPQWSIESPDAPLYAPGERALCDFPDRLPDGREFHFLLYDNVWGTNFPMWNCDAMRFRFYVNASPGK